MKKNTTLKKVLNGFKLFLALDFFGVGIGSMISSILNKETMSQEQLMLQMGVNFLFASIGVLLFIWFLKTHQKLQDPIEYDEHALESPFYLRNAKWIRYFENYSFNGCGAVYYTKNSKKADGSLQVIKWISLVHFPLIPLYQDKIKLGEEKHNTSFLFSKSLTNFEFLERKPINGRLVRLTYAFYYLFLFPAILAPIVLFLIFLKELNLMFPGASFWFLILAYFAWGIFLFFLADLWNTRVHIHRDL